MTVRHSPQQNSMAERKNRTIIEMALSMLKGKSLLNKLWAEAVNVAAYILNHSLTKVSFKAWFKRKPVVD